MRPFVIKMFALLLIPFTTIAQEETISQADLLTTCRTLAKLSNGSIDENNKKNVAVYYSAYMALKYQKGFSDCNDYFDGIANDYGNDIGDWTISTNWPPKRLPKMPETFDHKHVHMIEKMIEYNISLEDLDLFPLFEGLKKNEVNPANLINVNPFELRTINEGLGKLDFNKVYGTDLRQLPQTNYRLDEFNQKIEQTIK